MVMKKVLVKLHFWELPQAFDPGRFDLKTGNQVVVKSEAGQEVGQVEGFVEETSGHEGDSQMENVVLRKVNTEDLKKLDDNEKQKEAVLQKCRELIRKHALPMNLVNCEFSFDGGKITFTFTAESRVDFRNLVKDLSHAFQKSIRLQQIGIRDETKRLGDVGVCGRTLCCKCFLGQLGNVSSDLARSQQVAHRGSERISGACGRLMCCLSYEEELYRECCKNLPAVGSIIKTKQGEGEVIAWNVLKQTVKVRLDENTIIEVAIPGNEKYLKPQIK